VTRPRATLLVGLFAAALALRPQVVGAGPLIPEIRRDLGMSHAAAGLLGTIPVLCMGLFALAAGPFSRRVGSRAALERPTYQPRRVRVAAFRSRSDLHH